MPPASAGAHVTSISDQPLVPRKSTQGEVLRAIAFTIIIYLIMGAMGLIALPSAIISRRAALGWCKRYCRVTLFLFRHICGTRYEIRGEVPHDDCIVAAKHQSFLDVIMLTLALPQPRFVMKRELLFIPVFGYFARRIGCVAIDRRAGGEAVRSMLAGLQDQPGEGGQVVIFPQGTRVAPGASAPYRGGVVKLYTSFDLPITLASANTGWFWPRRGFGHKPGLAVVEFLDRIPVGRTTTGLLQQIESEIEASSDSLAREAAAARPPAESGGRAKSH